MTETRFDFPHLFGRENAGKRRVLAQPLAFVGLGTQSFAYFGDWTRQQLLPLGIATKQRRRVAILE